MTKIITKLICYGYEYYKDLSILIAALALIITPFQIRANRKNTVESAIYLEKWKSLNKMISNSLKIKTYFKNIINSAKNAKISNVEEGANQFWFEKGLNKRFDSINDYLSLSIECISIMKSQDLSSWYPHDNKILIDNMNWVNNVLISCAAELMNIKNAFYSKNHNDKSDMDEIISKFDESIKKLDINIIKLREIRKSLKIDVESGIIVRKIRLIFRKCINISQKIKKRNLNS